MSRASLIPQISTSVSLVLMAVACQNTPPSMSYQPSDAAGSTADVQHTAADPRGDETANSEVSPLGAAGHEALRTPLLSCDADGARSASPAGSCQRLAQGVYAVDVELDVWWQDTVDPEVAIFDPGRGKVRITSKLALGEFCADGRASAALQTCGLQLPQLYIDAEGGVLQLAAPDAVWDRADMPVATTTARVQGFGEDEQVALDKVSPTLGIELDRAASWPSYDETAFVACGQGRTGQACFVDQDGDGQPGITLTVQSTDAPGDALYGHPNGWRYTPMPTSPAPFVVGAGAARVFAALRTELTLPSLMGALGADCHGDGETQPATAQDVLLRVFDCTMRDGAPCGVAAATFVDQHIPAFHVLAAGEAPPATWKHLRHDADALLDRSPSQGPRSTTRWLADSDQNPSCDEVRSVANAHER